MTLPANPPLPEDFSSSAPSDAADSRRRLEFLQMGPEDAKRLRGMLTDFRRWSDDFVEVFYEHLFSFEETARSLQPPDKVGWLKQSQHEHFESMLEAGWDEGYVARRRWVGLAHAEAGIEPQYFLGAYNQYVQYSFERLAERHAGDLPAYKADVASLLKAIFYDIGLTLDAYFAESTRRSRQALDMYWKANTELRQFAQLTSHDLKTPLATVANLCDEALDEFGEQMPSAARDLVAAARDRTFRMGRMIDELLASAVSLESGDTDEAVSSQAAWDDAVDTFRPMLDERGIAVSVLGPLPTVRGNKALLREVFANLLSNAAKFIDRRPGSVTVSSQVRGDMCEIIIADNGPGMREEDFERVFVPFGRLSGHRDRLGSGLGLYFTKSLVSRQGGRIWITSELGRGTEFHIEMRLGSNSPPDFAG
jgi:signal transduction histidine kinase